MSESETNNTPAPSPAPQETTVIHNPAPNSSQSSANLMMAMVMLMILLIGVAAVFAFKGSSDSEWLERARLERQLSAEKGDSTGAFTLEGRVAVINENANQILADYSSMKVGYQEAQNQLKNAKSALNGNINTIKSISASNGVLTQENLKLRTLAGSAQSYKQQLATIRQQLIDKDKLMSDLRSRPSEESFNSLRSSLNSSQMSREQLSLEIQSLKQKMITMIDKSRVDQLKRRLPVLEKENAEFRNIIQAQRTELDFSSLFVKSQDLLPAKARLLYAELDILGDVNDVKLLAAYSKIQVALDAENLHQVKFAEGSSLLSFTDQATIQNKLAVTANTDYFLVVGYDSTTGDTVGNETLSANRAAAVASVVNQLKKQGQDVKAVFLGQTKRFSATKVSDNQLCEIWRIRK